MIYHVSPTKITIPKSDVSTMQVEQLKAGLTYTDKKIQFELTRLKNRSRWMTEEEFTAEQTSLKKQLKVCLLFEEKDQYWTYSGLRNFVAGTLRQEVVVRIEYPEPKLIPWETPPPHQMRPYQKTICDNLLQCKHGCVSVGTGLGKTLALTHLVKSLGLKTVVMAPSENIATQIYEDFLQRFGKKYVGRFFGGKKEPKKLFIVGTGQSLTRVKEGTPPWEELQKVQVFMADESHQTPASTFKAVCFGPLANAPYRFFFSATQMRNDGAGILLDGIIGPVVFDMTVQEGVDKKYLARPIFHMYTAPSNGDFDSREPEEMTRHHLYYNPAVVKHVGKLCNQAVKAGLPVLVLIDEVEQFSRLLPHLKSAPGFAHGTLTENKAKVPQDYWESDPTALVAQFNAGNLPILVGTSCISTGTDVRNVKFLIYWKGGKSEIEVKQGVGRGTRLVPGKTTCHVIDYWVQSPGGHDLVVPNEDGSSSRWLLGAHSLARKKIYQELCGPVIDEGAI